MLVTTMNDAPGRQIVEVYGEVGQNFQEVVAYGTAVKLG